MEIHECVQRLHEAFRRGDPSLGCVSRASLLACFMKSKGLNPEVRQFYFRDVNGVKASLTHCVVIYEDMVYDANIPSSNNPIPFEEYEVISKNQHQKLDIIWTDLNERDNPIDFVWHYLCTGCDKELQKEIKPLMQEEYQSYLKRYPHVEDMVYGEPS